MARPLTTLFLLLGLAFMATDLSPVAAAGEPGGSVAADTLTGVVREASGQPIPTARVELRVGGRTVASARTDRDGRFRLVLLDGAEGSPTLRVERFGYHAREQTLGSGDRHVEIVMSPAPLPLPGFHVEAARDVCTAREDPEARALWEAASRIHAGGLDTLGVATYLRGWTDTLQTGSGNGDVDRVGEPGQRASAPLLRLSWDRRVQREGYAFPVRRTDRERSFDSWSYPPLEADFAPHFVHPTFGELHRFQVEPDTPWGWILRFCTRDRRRPYLQGTLELGGDTLILRAEWSFRTTDPDEEAGGWARFPGAIVDGDPLPLPIESLIWRRLPDGELLRKAQSYEGWILAPGDSVPFLRSRKDEGTEGPLP